MVKGERANESANLCLGTTRWKTKAAPAETGFGGIAPRGNLICVKLINFYGAVNRRFCLLACSRNGGRLFEFVQAEFVPKPAAASSPTVAHKFSALVCISANLISSTALN